MNEASLDKAQETFHGTPVLEFHRVFEHPISCNPTHTPSVELRKLRVRLLAEELVELCCAFGVRLSVNMSDSHDPDDLTNEVTVIGNHMRDYYSPMLAADACGDLRYVVDGTNLVCGFPGPAVLAEIHRSNMSKAGADGRPVKRHDGKIMKGPNYTKPDLTHVLGIAWVQYMATTGEGMDVHHD